MPWETALLTFTLILATLLISGEWIAFSLGLAGVLSLWLNSGTQGFSSLGPIAWNATNSFVLTAAPLFIFMGEIIVRSGISEKFYKALSVWLRGIPGGLLHSNIVGCAFFAAVTGSSTATAAAIGSVAIPELRKRGYRPRLVLGSLAAGGTLGILIPPSLIMVLYGALVEVSVARLFMAGIVPGILLALMFMLYLFGRSAILRRAWTQGDSSSSPDSDENSAVSWRERLFSLVHLLPVMFLLVLVLGGIYLGVTTPTESAAIGAVGSLALAAAYGGLSWSSFRSALGGTVTVTSMIMFIFVGASIFSFALVRAGIDRALTDWILAMELSRWVLFGILVIAYIVLGFFMDGISIMFLTIPIIFSIITEMGFDPVWFGVIMTIVIEAGLITPPVGLNLFVIQGLSGSSLSDVALGCVPYVLIMVIMIGLLAVYPQLALWLPTRVLS